jgi:hypothetical protein
MTADQVARDLCGIIDDVPTAFTLNAIEYTGTRGALVTEKRVVEGGIFDVPELTITTCLKKVNASGKLVNRFPSNGEPTLGSATLGKVTSVGGVSGRDYRIVKLHRDEWEMGLQMDLESVHK